MYGCQVPELALAASTGYRPDDRRNLVLVFNLVKPGEGTGAAAAS